MKRYLSIALCMVVLSGCSQWKKLTGENDDKENHVDARGYWGNTVTLNNGPETFYLLMGQDGARLGGSTGGPIGGQIFGSVSGNAITITIDEGTRCQEKFTLVGDINGHVMSYRLTGAGNNIPGTTCYPDAVNITGTLTRQ